MGRLSIRQIEHGIHDRPDLPRGDERREGAASAIRAASCGQSENAAVTRAAGNAGATGSDATPRCAV